MIDEIRDNKMSMNMRPTDPKRIILNKKETRILSLIAEGKTSPQIAEILILSLPTIKWYRKRLKEKFEAETTVEMVSKAIKAGIL